MWYLMYLYLRLELFFGNYDYVRDLIDYWIKSKDKSFKSRAGWEVHPFLLKMKGYYICPSCSSMFETPIKKGYQRPSPKCPFCKEFLYPHLKDKEWYGRVRDGRIRRHNEYAIASMLKEIYGLSTSEAERAAKDEEIKRCCYIIDECRNKLFPRLSSLSNLSSLSDLRTLSDQPGEGFRLIMAAQNLAELAKNYRGRFP